MFYNCDLFDQSLAAWTIANVSNFTNFMTERYWSKLHLTTMQR